MKKKEKKAIVASLREDWKHLVANGFPTSTTAEPAASASMPIISKSSGSDISQENNFATWNTGAEPDMNPQKEQPIGNRATEESSGSSQTQITIPGWIGIGFLIVATVGFVGVTLFNRQRVRIKPANSPPDVLELQSAVTDKPLEVKSDAASIEGGLEAMLRRISYRSSWTSSINEKEQVRGSFVDVFSVASSQSSLDL